MTFLLDVNILIAAIWEDRADHARVNVWLPGKKTATCPISELGFLRISSGETFIFRAEVEICKKWLGDFVQKHQCAFIPDDFPPQKTSARTSRQLTDAYLAELAERHAMKLATFDTRISHHAVKIIA
jgi:predicted nucleic acid-binding protein